MSTKTDYTPEEWDQLKLAVFAAPTYIMLVSPSLLGMFSETSALTHGVGEMAAQAAPETVVGVLLRELDMKAQQAEMNRVKDLAKGDAAQGLAAMVDACRQAAALIDAKGTADEAKAYKDGVLALATRVAEAAKDEGVAVGPKEQAGLATLTQALGLGA